MEGHSGNRSSDSESSNARPRRKRPGRSDAAERSLRDLVGAGKSRVGVSGALRARDLNRPTDEDLETAEREVVIVRRHWQPPATQDVS